MWSENPGVDSSILPLPTIFSVGYAPPFILIPPGMPVGMPATYFRDDSCLVP